MTVALKILFQLHYLASVDRCSITYDSTLTTCIGNIDISEEPCPEGTIRCNSGDCVSSEFFCDGYADCPDRSDELYCCTETQFNCANGRCIEWDAWCDGTDNCRDNSDEDQCAGTK